jgi:hypothetical protein
MLQSPCVYKKKKKKNNQFDARSYGSIPLLLRKNIKNITNIK